MDALKVGWVFIDIFFLFKVAANTIWHTTSFLSDERPSDPVKDYLGLAKEMNRNAEHGIFRRFGDLNNLSLLYMQSEITILEKDFLTQRQSDCESSATEVYCTNMESLRRSEGGNSKQRDLLVEILPKLKAYSLSFWSPDIAWLQMLK